MTITPRERRARRTSASRLIVLLAALLAGCLLAASCAASVDGSPQRRGEPATAPGEGTTPPGDGSDTAQSPAPSTAGEGPVADAGTVEPFVVKGHVSTQDGRPLAGAEVWADNTLAYNSNALAVSGADGSYRIELPRAEALTWQMGGHIVTTYHGQQFDLDLAVDTTPFASADGAVRDFTWRLGGPHDDDHDLYYGGLVYVYEDVNHNELNDGDWQITFTPDGPLIDGSTGQAFTRDVTQGQIDGVPVGQYTVTASYLPSDGSGPVPLYIRPRDTGDYGPSATAGFTTDSGPLMQLEIVKP
mgnify:CR=1 FL=1